MASGIPTYAGPYNVTVPNHEATGNLVISYSRNEKDFPLNRYVKMIPVEKLQGYYLKMTNEEAGRLLTDGETDWADGMPRPLGLGTTESHAYVDYRIRRKIFNTPIGDMTANEADWNIRQQYQRINAQKAMTRRTKQAVTALTTSGNYASSHVSTVAAICGSSETFASSTGTTLNIKKCIDYAMNQIEKDSLSAVKIEDMVLVLNPSLASAMSITGELREYLKSSPYAGKVLTGEWSGASFRGLPPKLYDVNVVIENTTETTNKRGATEAKSYVMGNAVAALIARPGGLVNTDGDSFSTLSMFVHKQMDMLVESIRNERDKLTEEGVVDGTDSQVTAPVTGFLFTSAQ